MTGDDLDRVLRAWKRQAILWGAVIALLLASLTVATVRLIDHPGTVVVTCDPHYHCVGVER